MPPRTPTARFPLSLREIRLSALCHIVQTCRACSGMEGRKRVLSELNGDAKAQVMFVAEAPGRNGADRTGIPLHGDPTGHNFETLLGSVGWKREDVFVTNCVLCNPRDEAGNNRPPSGDEIETCSVHLESQIRIVDPHVVVTLGANPLTAMNLIQPHDLTLRDSVARPWTWLNRVLFPLYHPSPRALIARNLGQQRKDFEVLRQLVLNLLGGY